MALLSTAGAWLLGKAKGVWPWLLLGLAALLAFLGAFSAARKAGQRAERIRHMERSLTVERERKAKDAEVSRASDPDLDQRLGRWMRHNGGL
jgi:uncharacterized membrane protein